MSVVKCKVGDFIVFFDISSFFKVCSDIVVNFMEDSNLVFDDFVFFVYCYFFRDVVDEVFVCWFIKDFLLQGVWGVEVFFVDFRQECNCFFDEMCVSFIYVNFVRLYFNGVDRGDIVWFCFLVIESYRFVLLEVVKFEVVVWCIDR